MNTKITTVLDRIDSTRTEKNATWNIDKTTGEFLNSLVRAKKVMRILEIGTSTGYSGIWLAEALPENGELVTVESHAERFEIAKTHFEESGLTKKITQVKGHAPEILDSIEGTFDLMFFDATKYEHISYFENLEDRLNPNGIIITDNITSHSEELADYIDFVEKKQNFQSSILSIGTGLMVSTKLN